MGAGSFIVIEIQTGRHIAHADIKCIGSLAVDGLDLGLYMIEIRTALKAGNIKIGFTVIQAEFRCQQVSRHFIDIADTQRCILIGNPLWQLPASKRSEVRPGRAHALVFEMAGKGFDPRSLVPGERKFAKPILATICGADDFVAVAILVVALIAVLDIAKCFKPIMLTGNRQPFAKAFCIAVILDFGRSTERIVR